MFQQNRSLRVAFLCFALFYIYSILRLRSFRIFLLLFPSFQDKIFQNFILSSRVSCLRFGDSDLSMLLTSAKSRRAEIPPGTSTRPAYICARNAQDRHVPLINRSSATLSSCSTSRKTQTTTAGQSDSRASAGVRSPGSFNYWQRRVCMRNACPRILR